VSEPGIKEQIAHYAQGIRQALTLPAGHLSPETVAEARSVLKKSSARMGMGEDYTVVAFAGSTGSGKSSLFNAVSGLELARVGVRRPTTSKPTACVWGDGAQDLLDWLEVPQENRTWRESALDGDDERALHGLVLLDLPDHDSTAVEHREESDRMVGLVDVLVWVVDPQKYADFALHSRYLSQMSEQDSSMVVVLNQVDRLAPEDREIAATHLRSLLTNDGLDQTDVLLASAKSREGVKEIRERLVRRVSERAAASQRLVADLRTVARRIQSELGEPVADPQALPGAARLVSAMTDAAGVDALGQTVHDDYTRRSYQATGYPPLVWMQRGKADPLGSRHGANRAALIRASVPATTPTQSAQVGLAAHEVVAEAAASLPSSWRSAVSEAERSTASELTDSLDQAVTGVQITTTPPGWWATARFFQWLFFILTLVGLIGTVAAIVLAVAGTTGVSWPVWIAGPVALLVGLIGSLVTSRSAKGGRDRGADEAEARVHRDLEQAVLAAAAGSYLAPVTEVLAEHKAVFDSLR
jgi:GTP-binding protein EngB required for normal cell division